MSRFEATERTTLARKPERGTYDTSAIHGILDEGFVASVAVILDGSPHVQPMLYARDDDRLILHGSASNGLLAHLKTGARLCLNVTLVDGLVLGRSVPDHSVNYRSVNVYGVASEIEEEPQKLRAMKIVFDSMIAQRWEHLPPVPTMYLKKATRVFSLPLVECVAKVRRGPPASEPADRKHPIWCGVLPFFLGVDTPLADPAIPQDEAQRAGPADALRNYRRPQRRHS